MAGPLASSLALFGAAVDGRVLAIASKLWSCIFLRGFIAFHPCRMYGDIAMNRLHFFFLTLLAFVGSALAQTQSDLVTEVTSALSGVTGTIFTIGGVLVSVAAAAYIVSLVRGFLSRR